MASLTCEECGKYIGRHARYGIRHSNNYEWSEENRIGKGTFGAVYNGWHRLTNSRVAVKVTINNIEYPPEYREYFDQLKKLQCPFIVRYLDQEQVHDSLKKEVLVMEIADCSVREELSKAKNHLGLPLQHFAILVEHCTKALIYLDSQNIAHRNWNPTNILIFKTPKLLYKLCGFTLSRRLERADELMHSMLGTLPYMLPALLESIEGCFSVEYTKDEFDIWSLTCSFFECATGLLPFETNGEDWIKELAELFANRPPDTLWARYDHEKNKCVYHSEMPRQDESYPRDLRDLLCKFFQKIFRQDMRCLNVTEFYSLCEELTSAASVAQTDLTTERGRNGVLHIPGVETRPPSMPEQLPPNPDEGLSQNYRWWLHDRLGKGAFAKVYRGRRRDNTGPDVAVKVFRADAVLGRDDFRLVHELDCQFIVHYYAQEPAVYDNRRWVLVMELADGNVEDELKEPENKLGYPRETFILLVKHCVSALEYLDSRPSPIAHRDLKPANIVFCNQPTRIFKLTDFGFAKTLQGRREVMTSVLGSPAYMLSTTLNARVNGVDALPYTREEIDLWAVACTFFHCGTGRLPFLPREQAWQQDLVEMLQNRTPDTVYMTFEEDTMGFVKHEEMPQQHPSYSRQYRHTLGEFFKLMFKKNRENLEMRRFGRLCREMIVDNPE